MNTRLFLISFGFLTLTATQALAVDVQGHTGIEARYFTEQSASQTSAFGEFEWYWAANSQPSSITLKAFGRIDDTDDERTHGDIRELSWLYYQDTWELKAGISKVFWGVTESAHRVDIINQTDAVESPDGEKKLGQPMIHFASIRDWGVLNAFVMPYFRERNFEGIDGYLGPDVIVDNKHALYLSDSEEKHVDIALRYSHTFDIWDLGLSYFQGTDREPLMLPTFSNDGFTLTPFYTQIQQSGIDLQATIEQWLWKLEAIHKSYRDREAYINEVSISPPEDFSALTVGFEYTLVGLAGTAMDLGVLTEYHYNTQDNAQQIDPLQNDVFIGARLTFNDIQNTALLAGWIQDLDASNSTMAFIEASRRLYDNWVITLDGRLFANEAPSDPLNFLNRADHLTLQAAYYF